MKLTTGSNLKIHQGKPSYQYLAVFTATLIIITSGMHYGWPSPSLPILEHQDSTMKLSNDEGSWLAVMPLLGALLGATLAGATVDILGRKLTILISTFPFFTAWILVAYSKSVIVLYTARFIAGVADGWVFTAVPMYIGEIAEPKIRGLLGASVSVTWIFGILLINIIGSHLSITVTALIASVLPILSVLTFSWMPESPYYLLMKGNVEGARKSLQTFRGINDVESELNRISNAIKTQMANTGKFFDLVTVKSNRKALFIMMILRGTQQFSGTTAITFYTQKIFKEVGDNISSELATTIYFSVQLVLTMFSSSIVDRAGRKPLLIISCIGSSLALMTEAVYFYIKQHGNVNVESFSLVPVISLLAFVVIFSLGMQIVPLLMLGELFPANVKAFALCFGDIYFCIMATISSKFFQLMKDSFGIYVPFFAFSICCLLGLVVIIFIVPETKGKTLEDIQKYLRGEVEDNNDEENIKSRSSVI